MKKLRLSLFVLLALFWGILPVCAQDTVNLYLNEKNVTEEASPIIINDRTMVPVRFIAENMGYTVTWDDDTRSVAVSGHDLSFTLSAGSNTVYTGDGQEILLDTALCIVNDKSMVPLRFFSEQIGLGVVWDAASQTVFLTGSAQSASKTDQDSLFDRKIYFSIELQDGRSMSGELYPDLAPVTVSNFVKLAKENFYDGLIFHRVISGFMIQGGGYDTSFIPKQTDSISGEFTANGFSNSLKHTKGVLSMARTSDPDSASSQFFIMHADAQSLDGQYAAFGKVTEGLEVIDEIASVPTFALSNGMQDIPLQPIVIRTVTIKDE